jgi:hypothetical protein
MTVTIYSRDSIDGNGKHHTSSQTTSYIGRGLITIGQTQFVAVKVREEYKEAGTALGGYTIDYKKDSWYVPALGKIVKVTNANYYHDSEATYNTGDQTWVTSFTLK